ncbi:MAG: hypothetical protein HFE63_09370 [Clostridiales bacterium]|nr:hypothetical protein [Clostridiales bacterium]
MSAKGKRSSHSGINEYYWGRLDNAAKLVPAVSDTRGTNVFRVSAILRDEVRPDILQKALERALKLLPAFAVKLHHGLFWYYFDANREIPRVREEHRYPCSPILGAHENGFLFRVTYYHKRINLEVFHALSDGMGTTQFLHLILFCYFNLLDDAEMTSEFIRSYCERIARDFDEDSFARNSEIADNTRSDSVVSKPEKESDAFHIQGYSYDGTRLNVLCALMPTDKLLALAHDSSSTMSEYMCALIIYSIINTSYRHSKHNRPIAVSLPVNLRGMFGSTTMRNFFGHVNIAVTPKDEMTFDDVLGEVKERFKACLTRGYFERQIADNVRIEKIPPVKFVPIWIKDLIMRYFFSRAEKKYTITFSNLGRMQLPEAIAGKLRRFEMLLGASRTHPKKISMCSYNNELALSFSSTIDDNSLERFMIMQLVERGIDVSIVSNETPEPEKVKNIKPEKKPKADKNKNKTVKKERVDK